MSLSAASPRTTLSVSFVALSVVMTAFHVLTSVGGRGDQWAVALLLLAALIMVVTGRLLRREFHAQPAALLCFHVGAFLLIAGTIAVHALAAGAHTGAASGVLWMVAIWGTGLIVHAMATVGAYLPKNGAVSQGMP